MQSLSFLVNMFVSYRQTMSAEVLQSQRLVSCFALFIDVATSINNAKSDTSHCKHQWWWWKVKGQQHNVIMPFRLFPVLYHFPFYPTPFTYAFHSFLLIPFASTPHKVHSLSVLKIPVICSLFELNSTRGVSRGNKSECLHQMCNIFVNIHQMASFYRKT